MKEVLDYLNLFGDRMSLNKVTYLFPQFWFVLLIYFDQISEQKSEVMFRYIYYQYDQY